MKNPNDPIGNRTRDLQAWSTVPQPTLPPCTPRMALLIFIIIKTSHVYIVLKYVGLVLLPIVVFSLELLNPWAINVIYIYIYIWSTHS